ncbi:MAG: hypothetical protein EBS09_11790 [Flavobacteriia bacterium]|nr:hypothetical protein [Flavobacteriia bacterium]
MKQTAVEWLVEQLPMRIKNSMMAEIEQAKEMEKEKKKCYHPLTERKYTSDTHFECTICGDNNY